MTIDTLQRAECRIYAACLASYNNGRLFGEWIDCDGKSADEIGEAINDMLARSPYPNVMRRKCGECGHYQTDAHPYRENSDECPSCGEALSGEFRPSAEEWAIHDHEGFAGLIKSEWPDLADVAAMAEGLSGPDRFGFIWLVADRGMSPSEAVDRAEEVRVYQADVHDLAGDYAQELFEEMGTADERDRLNQWPFTCIDWEQAGKELLMGGDVDLSEADGERFLVTNASEF